MGVLEYGEGVYGIGDKQGKKKKGHGYSLGRHMNENLGC